MRRRTRRKKRRTERGIQNKRWRRGRKRKRRIRNIVVEEDDEDKDEDDEEEQEEEDEDEDEEGRCDGAVVKKRRHLSRVGGFDSPLSTKVKTHSLFIAFGAIPLAVVWLVAAETTKLPLKHHRGGKKFVKLKQTNALCSNR